MNGILDCFGKSEKVDLRHHRREGLASCHICQHGAPSLLRFGSPCNHTFCEPCMWNHLVDQVPLCTNLRRNVVTCPICNKEFEGFQCHEGDRNSERQNDIVTKQKERSSKTSEEKKDEEDTLPMNNLALQDVYNGGKHQEESASPLELRQQRRLDSLAKFMTLPANSKQLKSSKKSKRRKPRDSAHSTWEDALRPTIQGHQTRDVRSDRFFRAVHSPHLIIGYLEAGIDVNSQNDYGQTPLYISCWRGSAMVVKLLLEYGANSWIAANGGSTCYSVAKKHGRKDVLSILDRYALTPGGSTSSSVILENRSLAPPKKYQVSVLIDPAIDHPGAGACVVDNALSEDQLHQLEQLYQTLPVADACEEITEENSININMNIGNVNSDAIGKSTYRPSRSYFCDAEESVQMMLEGCVQAARKGSSSSDPKSRRSSSPSVFQHIRFLNYEKPGGILPPHVDLCRIDDASGLRSTHTFILYLTDCEKGGGTALLKQLKDPKVLAVSQPKRGRVLMFPHLCPHSGLEVDSAPKLLLRGEVILD
ncbi:hypothetical protein ACHAXR_002137 [Thalassiosira sp. AJA248-18]